MVKKLNVSSAPGVWINIGNWVPGDKVDYSSLLRKPRQIKN